MLPIRTTFIIKVKKLFNMAYYIVHKDILKKNIEKLKKSYLDKKLNFELFYSVKTNFSDPVLSTISENGCSYEILSDFEYQKINKYAPNKLVLNGPCKSLELVKNILNKVQILYFNIDNDTDFEILKKISNCSHKNKIKVGVRAYINANGIWNRFGYDIESKQFIEMAKKIQLITNLSGIHFHFSINNFKINNYQLLFEEIKKFLNQSKINIEFLDIGGGLPAANEFIYNKDIYETLPTLIIKFFSDIKIISEAGRNIVSDAVDINAKIISLKKGNDNKFQINIDTNIMHFQCFFEKKFWLEYVPTKKWSKKPVEIEICGNSCMQIDKLTDSMMIEQFPQVNDEIIIHNVGAYSYSQAANFISEIPKTKII